MRSSRARTRRGRATRIPTSCPISRSTAADQPIIIAIGNDRQFARLAAICGHPEWAADERFRNNAARVANRDEMVRLVGDAIAAKGAAEWLRELEAAGIPAGPINRISQALADVQAQHRGMVRTIAGMPLVGSPLRLEGERADSDLPPPALGEHTRDVLGQIGLDEKAIVELEDAGIVGR